MNKVKVSPLYKSINSPIQHALVVLHVACHVPFIMTSSVTLVTLYITIVSQLHEDQRTVAMNTKQSVIATTGLKLVNDVGLFNMITKPTL